MSTIDQFESVFRSATKTQFEFSTIDLKSVLLVTDLSGEELQNFESRV